MKTKGIAYIYSCFACRLFAGPIFYTPKPENVPGKQIYLYVIISLMMVLVPAGTFGQQYFQVDQDLADSLERLISTTQGKEKIDLMNRLAHDYAWVNPERSMVLTKEALELSSRINYLKGIGEAYLEDGYRVFLHNESGDQLFKALKIFEEIDDEELVAIANTYIASGYYFSGSDVQKIVEYALKGLRYFEKVNEVDEMANLYIALAGTIANVADDPAAAESWINKFMDIASQANIPNLNKGVGWAIAGDIQYALGNPDEGLSLYLKALSIYDEGIIEEKAVKSQQSGAIGSYYLNLGNLDSAIVWLNKCIQLARPITYVRGLSGAYSRIAAYYYKIGQPEEAIIYYDSAIYYASLESRYGSLFEKEEYWNRIGWSYEIYRPASKDFKSYIANSRMLRCYRELSAIYTELDMQDELLECYRNMLPLKDAYYQFLRKRDLEITHTRFENEYKDQQISLLSERNRLNEFRVRQVRYFLVGLAGMIILIIIVAILLIRQNKLRSEQRTAILEQKLLRSQMNPHFIFNALSTIQNLISRKDHETAATYLVRFSSLLRHILESTRNDYIDLDDEISNLENYMSLQRLRFGDKFDFQIDVDEKIDPEAISIPSMLIQPFVENAIEHGIKPKEDKGRLSIIMNRENGLLTCEIWDDGIGREQAMALRRRRHKPMATSITKERLDALNRKLKNKVTLEITDLKAESGGPGGTKVRISIPILEK